MKTFDDQIHMMVFPVWYRKYSEYAKHVPKHWRFEASCNVQPTKKIYIEILYIDIPACGSVGFFVEEECGSNSWLCAKLMTCCNGSVFFIFAWCFDRLGTDFQIWCSLCGKLYHTCCKLLKCQFSSLTYLSIYPPGGGSIHRFEASTTFPASGNGQVLGVFRHRLQ